MARNLCWQLSRVALRVVVAKCCWLEAMSCNSGRPCDSSHFSFYAGLTNGTEAEWWSLSLARAKLHLVVSIACSGVESACWSQSPRDKEPAAAGGATVTGSRASQRAGLQRWEHWRRRPVLAKCELTPDTHLSSRGKGQLHDLRIAASGGSYVQRSGKLEVDRCAYWPLGEPEWVCDEISPARLVMVIKS